MFDAVTIPFSVVERGKKEYSKDDIEQMKSELYEAIMRNPVMGDMMAQWMIEELDKDGVNPWLKTFEDEYNDFGASIFVHKNVEDDVIYVTDEYRLYAKRILTFLDRCTVEGVKVIATSDFWYLNDSLDGGSVRTKRNEDRKRI